MPCSIFLSQVHHSLLKHIQNTPPPHMHAQTHTHTHTHTVLSFLDVSVHDSLAANPSVGWMSVSSPFIICLIRHPRHCFYISQQSHWQLMALSLRLYSFPSFLFSPPPAPPPPPSLSRAISLFFPLDPQCPTCRACTPDSAHVCGRPCTLLRFPTSTAFFTRQCISPSSTFCSSPPLISPLSMSLSIYLSLSCAPLGPEWHLQSGL